MNKVTHRKVSVGFAYIAMILLYNLNMLRVNYFLAFIIMVSVSQLGAKFPDYDHAWKNVADKDAIKYVINKLIHLMGGTHRSRQTHSIDIFLIVSAGMLFGADWLFRASEVNSSVAITIVTGFICGWASHLFADALTTDGVYVLCWMNFKIKLVPKRLTRVASLVISLALLLGAVAIWGVILDDRCLILLVLAIIISGWLVAHSGLEFKTGDEWEQMAQKFFATMNIVVGLVSFTYPFIMAYVSGVLNIEYIMNNIIGGA